MAKKQDEITARDLFAAAALTGILADSKNLEDSEGPSAVQWAFQLADAMMHQRSQRPCTVDENGYVHSPTENEQ